VKICLVNHEFIPLRGSGQVVYAEQLAKGLAQDHDVTVVTALRPGTRQSEVVDNIRILRIPINRHDSSLWLSFSFRVTKFLKTLNIAENFNVVHFLDCHLAHSYQDPYVATLFQSFRQRISSNAGLPYYSSFSNLLLRYPYYSYARMLESRAVKKATTLLASSHATKAEFLEHYPSNAQNVSVVHLGIDTNFFKPCNTSSFSRQLNIEGKRIILYVGFSTPRKGLEYLLKAMHLLTIDNAVLLIAGKWEPGYRDSLNKLIEATGDQVIELGYVPDEKMPELYSSAELLVMPSLLEGFGYPLAEAMACGTPPIGSSAGSIPEIIGEFGKIVPPMDAVGLANAIESGLRDNDKKFQSRALNSYIKENFSIDSMITNTLSAYDQHIRLSPKVVHISVQEME
jgi:glycosyltransferase involved in cell wall biosynthesis